MSFDPLTTYIKKLFAILLNSNDSQNSSALQKEQTHYWQNDSKWGGYKFFQGKRNTLGESGCVLSCLASMLTDLGWKYDPKSLAIAAKENGCLSQNGNCDQQKLIEKITNKKYTLQKIKNPTPAHFLELQNKKALIELRVNGKHSVRLENITKIDEQNYLLKINDPGRQVASIERKMMKNGEKWEVDNFYKNQGKPNEISYAAYITENKTKEKNISKTFDKGGFSETSNVTRSGFDTHQELMSLFHQKVKTIQEVTHVKSGKKGYEVTLESGEKTLLYDGFKNQNRKDLMAIREYDQNGDLGYNTNTWKKGEIIKAENTDLKEIVLSGRQPEINTMKGLQKEKILEIKQQKFNAKAYEVSSCIGGALGGTLANIDRMSGGELITATTKSAVFGYGMNKGIQAGQNILLSNKAIMNNKTLSSKVPYLGYVVSGAFAAKDVFQALDSDSLSGGEKAFDIMRTVATNVVSFGTGIIGMELGAQVGLLGGPAGAIAGGLIGGLFGGLIGGLYGRALETPFRMNLYYDSSNSSKNNDSGNNPCISWDFPPRSAKSYAITCFLEGEVGEKKARLCSWCLINIPSSKREVESKHYEGKKIENHLKTTEYIGPNTQSTYLQDGTKVTLNKITVTIYALDCQEAKVNNVNEFFEMLNKKSIKLVGLAEQSASG